MKTIILTFIASAIFFYLAGAFISLEANPANWPEAGRVFYLLFTLIPIPFVGIEEAFKPKNK